MKGGILFGSTYIIKLNLIFSILMVETLVEAFLSSYLVLKTTLLVKEESFSNSDFLFSIKIFL